MRDLKHDKKDDDPKYRTQIEEATKAAEVECKNLKGQMGYCHALWGSKKRILSEKYRIKWKSPAEMNPHCKFD